MPIVLKATLVTLIVSLGSLLQGAVGFGLGLFSVPFLVLLDPRLVPGPILLASGVLTLVMLRRERHAVLGQDLKWSLGGRVVGTGVALGVLTLVPLTHLGVVFGVLILGAVGLSASGWRVATSPSNLVGAGALSGFLATTVSIGGPPVALLYQHAAGPEIRATLSAFFLVGTVLSLTGLHFIGRFGLSELLLGLGLVPGIAIGFLLSKRIVGVVDRGLLRPAILTVSAVAALGVVVKALLP